MEPLYRVGVLPIPGFALMSYACTVEPLRAANLLAQRPLYEVVHFAATAGSDGAASKRGNQEIASSGAATIKLSADASDPTSLDLLLIIAGGDPFAFDDERLFSFLQQLGESGVRLGGVSGGPVILAKAALMAGRRMTVHWEHAEPLSELYPECLIERRLYVIDRDRVTCGGGIAPLDMMHALIAGQHGSAFARLVSDWFLHTDIRVAAAPQRSEIGERLSPASPHVVEAIKIMESHVGDPLSLTQLALTSGISERHLNRLFVAALGVPTMQHYRALRLTIGRRLLRHSAMSIAEIAQAVGFANASHFSNAYKAQLGVRPHKDRR